MGLGQIQLSPARQEEIVKWSEGCRPLVGAQRTRLQRFCDLVFSHVAQLRSSLSWCHLVKGLDRPRRAVDNHSSASLSSDSFNFRYQGAGSLRILLSAFAEPLVVSQCSPRPY